MSEKLHTDDFEIIKILKMCISANWAEGFMTLINSETTKKIFINSTLDFKEHFVKYAISDSALENDCICSKKHENYVKEVKDRMVQYPYCTVSWLFIDPFQDEKNARYIKSLLQNFDKAAMELLAQSNQL